MLSSEKPFGPRFAAGVLAIVTILLPVGGLGQEAGVTTVEPLTVTPPHRDPDTITARELSQSIEAAHDDGLGAIWYLCALPGSGSPGTEAQGAFSERALFYTQLQTGVEVRKAAQALLEANQKYGAISASGATAEALAKAQADRQSAAGRYDRARRINAEASQRLYDFQSQWDVQVNWDGPDGATVARTPDMNYFHQLMALYHVSTVPEVMEILTRQRMESRVVEGVYVPLEYSDLRISEVQARKVTVRGRPAMQINGQIHNTRDIAIAVPPLWFTAVDTHDEPLRSEQAVAEAAGKRIQPSTYVTFNFIMQPSPQATDHMVVTFAPKERRRIPNNPVTSCPSVSKALRDAFEKGDIPPPDAPWITGRAPPRIAAQPGPSTATLRTSSDGRMVDLRVPGP